MCIHRINILSLNLWNWGPDPMDRFNKMSKFIQNLKPASSPDVILIQEALKDTYKEEDSSYLLAEKLNYEHFFHTTRRSIEGLGLLVKKNLGPLKFKARHLMSRFDDKDYFRMIAGVDFIYEKQKIRVVNIHLAHQANYTDARKRQLKEGMDWLLDWQKKSPADLLILGGDFNTGRAENYYGNEFEIIEQKITSNKMVFIDNNDPFQKTWKDFDSHDEQRVDHIFLGLASGLELLNFKEEVLGFNNENLRYSDHNALLHSYEWNSCEPKFYDHNSKYLALDSLYR
jgi:endonuclease/exonuclease/phosphatase family metal-dependent hydrolase